MTSLWIALTRCAAKPQSVRHLVTATGVALLVVVASITLASISRLRSQAYDALRANASEQAAILASNAAEAFSAARYFANAIAREVVGEGIQDPDDLEDRFDTVQMRRLLRAMEGGSEAVNVVALLDVQGRLVSSSRHLPHPLSLADREAFTVAREGTAFHVSSPVLSRLNGEWTIYVSKGLQTPAGRFVGTVMVGLSRGYFAHLYAGVKLLRTQPDAVTVLLLREDQSLLASSPGAYARGSAGAGSQTQRTSAAGTSESLPLHGFMEPDGRDIAVWSPVARAPAMIKILVDDKAVDAAWHRDARQVLGFASVAMLFLATTLSILVSMLRRRESHQVQVQRLQVAADAAGRAKSQFLGVMSHELRTPLVGILGTADVLLRSPLSDHERSLLTTLQASGKRLLSVIDDMLDFVRLEAGDLALTCESIKPIAVARGVIDQFDDAARQRDINLRLNAAPRLPDTVIADGRRLAHVLTHIVDNAIKFTGQHGAVTVRIDMPAQWILRFEVSDTGAGISEAARERVLQPFTQHDGGDARQHEGAGLGLAIARKLVELMKGKLDFTSEPGVGSVFWFDIPVSPGALPSKEGGAADSATAAIANPHVLVVEDNEVNAMVLQAQLRSIGCDAEVATDGQQALRRMNEAHFHMVFLDCMLPGLSGLDVARLRREQERNTGLSRLPIVALTANTHPDNRAQALAAGMDDFVAKPCNAQTLAARVRWWTCAGEMSAAPGDP